MGWPTCQRVFFKSCPTLVLDVWTGVFLRSKIKPEIQTFNPRRVKDTDLTTASSELLRTSKLEVYPNENIWDVDKDIYVSKYTQTAGQTPWYIDAMRQQQKRNKL